MSTVAKHKSETDPKAIGHNLHLAPRQDDVSADDGTRQLLLSGGWTLLAGLLAALITEFFLGGIGRQGPHTSFGWLGLILALNCLPFGVLLSLLGFAKWLRNQRLKKK